MAQGECAATNRRAWTGLVTIRRCGVLLPPLWAMRTAILLLLLAVVLALLSRRLQAALRRTFQNRPALLLAMPVILTGVFMAIAAWAGAASVALGVLLLAYTGVPSVCAWIQGPGPVKRPALL